MELAIDFFKGFVCFQFISNFVEAKSKLQIEEFQRNRIMIFDTFKREIVNYSNCNNSNQPIFLKFEKNKFKRKRKKYFIDSL